MLLFLFGVGRLMFVKIKYGGCYYEKNKFVCVVSPCYIHKFFVDVVTIGYPLFIFYDFGIVVLSLSNSYK